MAQFLVYYYPLGQSKQSLGAIEAIVRDNRSNRLIGAIEHNQLVSVTLSLSFGNHSPIGAVNSVILLLSFKVETIIRDHRFTGEMNYSYPSGPIVNWGIPLWDLLPNGGIY